LETFKALPDTTHIGIITFSSVISVYDLSNPSIVTADVLSGMNDERWFLAGVVSNTNFSLQPTALLSPTEEQLSQTLERPSNYVTPLSECQKNLAEQLEAIASSSIGRSLAQPLRGLGTAIEVAMYLTRTSRQSSLTERTSEEKKRNGNN
jgi:hypothetical protein